MKLTLETRRISLIDSITVRTINEDGMKNYIELLRYDWKDFEDFEKKYGSEDNVEAAARRYAIWTSYNSIGGMIRKGVVQAEDIYDLGLSTVVFLWEKYKPIIEEIRKRYHGKDYLIDLEYLANEMMRLRLIRDPSYKIPENLDKYVPNV